MASEVATQAWLDAVTAYAMGGGKPDLPVSVIAAALSAAEARGRQQAEQARDDAQQEYLRQVHIFSTELHAEKQRSAALTQALKDASQQIRDIDGNQSGTLRDIADRLDAALTGAQA